MHSDNQWNAWADALAQNDYVVIDDYLSPNVLQQLLDFFDARRSDFEQAQIGAWQDRQLALEVRSDLTFWLDRQRDIDLAPLFDWIDESLRRWNELLFLSLSGHEFHLAYYPSGGHYRKHLDQFRGRNNRLLSCVLYLNEGWAHGDGGELRLFDEKGEKERACIEPLINRMVFFRSDKVWHEVLPTQVARKSLTGWFLYHPRGVGAVLGA